MGAKGEGLVYEQIVRGLSVFWIKGMVSGFQGLLISKVFLRQDT